VDFRGLYLNLLERVHFGESLLSLRQYFPEPLVFELFDQGHGVVSSIDFMIQLARLCLQGDFGIGCLVEDGFMDIGSI
jgi:hypothetical protein